MNSRFRTSVASLLAASRPGDQPNVTESDLATLPPAIARYLQRAGVVGRPRVANFRAQFAAQMRNGRDAPWMRATVDQWDFFQPKARVFLMRARRAGIPLTAFHRYVGGEAEFDVRLAGIIPLFKVSGPTMTKSETVTLLNDMCILAPASLLDSAITWTEIDAGHVRADFTNAGHHISAVLTFDSSGDLSSFRSDDRHQNDGKRDRQLPWVTPVSAYCIMGGARLAKVGEARWVDDGGEWTYARFELQRIDYNCRTQF